MNPFQRPMQAWSGLELYARFITLPKSGLTLYLYQTSANDLPAMVLIHGLGDEADTWRHLIPPLSAHFQVIAPDLPGFGRSDKPDLPYTPSFIQETLLELMDTLGVQHATLVGHSLGAILAHSIALNHPACVDRTVLIASSLVMKVQKIDLMSGLFLIPGLGEWLYNRLRKDPQAAYRTLKPYYYDLESLPQTEKDFLFQRVNERVWSDGQRRAFFSTFRSMAGWLRAQQKDLPARLKLLECPTILIWGEADAMVAIENAKLTLDIQPTAKLVTIPGAGHNVHQEKPHDVLAAILD